MIYVTFGGLGIQLKQPSSCISNNLQESIKNTGIVMALSIDHSHVFLSLFDEKCEIYGHGFSKSDSSLIYDTENVLTLLRMGFFGTAHGWGGGGERSPLP